MSVLTALYQTYCSALDNNMVDQTEQLQQRTILLPVYHSSKKSGGTHDIAEVTLSENGKFIKAEWLSKDRIIIFPITESSIARAGKVVAHHPLCDELSYLSNELNPEKHAEYEKVRKDWVSYMEDGHPNRLLLTVNEYLCRGTVFKDCIDSLFAADNCRVEQDHTVRVNVGDKSEKVIKLDKTFITFRVESMDSTEKDLAVSTSQELHQHYINYIRVKNAEQPQEQCDISGKTTYCVSRHRGLLGNAKLVSISNHDETYYGRFNDGEEIVHIGYETSQRIHLMLKYLLENDQNRKKIGDSSFLVNWFSNDIGNEEGASLVDSFSSGEDLNEEEDEEGDICDTYSPKTFGEGISVSINEYLSGKKTNIPLGGKFYIMILDKISNGRISIKYFRELPKAELFHRVERWYETTNWLFFYGKARENLRETPSLFRYADVVFGMENEKGYIECRNSKLKTKNVERLLSCVLDNRGLPIYLKDRMLENLCNRNSYDKTWDYAVSVGCSIFKKYQIDYQNKKEVNEMLDESKQGRSYLHGRLLAVYETMEKTALNRDPNNPIKRATNAERLWSAYTKSPERTLGILVKKIEPYKEILIKNNYNFFRRYDEIITNVTGRIREQPGYEKQKNKPLDEDFVFGYYAQKQDLYKKKEKKQNNEAISVDEGGKM